MANIIIQNVNHFLVPREKQFQAVLNAASVPRRKSQPVVANVNVMASLKTKNGTLTMKMICNWRPILKLFIGIR